MVPMEFQIAFPTDSPADLEIRISGVPTLAELELLNAALVADPRFRAGLRILVDVSELDSGGITGEDVETMSAPIVVRDWEYPPSAVAIVASGGANYDIIRLYRAHLGGSKSNRTVFQGREDALAWLELKKESGPG